MRRNRVIYILAVIGCLVFSAVYRSRLSAVLLAAVAVYPVLALLLTAAGILCIKAEVTEERSIYETFRLICRSGSTTVLFLPTRPRSCFAYFPTGIRAYSR